MSFQSNRLAVIFFVLLLATACTSNREPAPQPEITNPEQEVSEDGPATTVWYDLPEPCRLLRFEMPLSCASDTFYVCAFSYDTNGRINGGTLEVTGDTIVPLQVDNSPTQQVIRVETLTWDFCREVNWYYQAYFNETEGFYGAYFEDLNIADFILGMSVSYSASGRLDSLRVGGPFESASGKVTRLDSYGNPIEIEFKGERRHFSYVIEYDYSIKSPLFGHPFVCISPFMANYIWAFTPHCMTKFTRVEHADGRTNVTQLHYEVDSLGYASACYKADGSLVYRVEIEVL